MKFQAFHVNPGEKLKKKMLITILAILCQSFLLYIQLGITEIHKQMHIQWNKDYIYLNQMHYIHKIQ